MSIYKDVRSLATGETNTDLASNEDSGFKCTDIVRPTSP